MIQKLAKLSKPTEHLVCFLLCIALVFGVAFGNPAEAHAVVSDTVILGAAVVAGLTAMGVTFASENMQSSDIASGVGSYVSDYIQSIGSTVSAVSQYFTLGSSGILSVSSLGVQFLKNFYNHLRSISGSSVSDVPIVEPSSIDLSEIFAPFSTTQFDVSVIGDTITVTKLSGSQSNANTTFAFNGTFSSDISLTTTRPTGSSVFQLAGATYSNLVDCSVNNSSALVNSSSSCSASLSSNVSTSTRIYLYTGTLASSVTSVTFSNIVVNSVPITSDSDSSFVIPSSNFDSTVISNVNSYPDTGQDLYIPGVASSDTEAFVDTVYSDVDSLSVSGTISGTIDGEFEDPTTGSSKWLRIPILGSILQWLINIYNAIVSWLQQVVSAISGGFTAVLQALGDFFPQIGEFALDFLGLISGYSLFNGLFSHFLPYEVAMALWVFWQCIVGVWLFRMVLNR